MHGLQLLSMPLAWWFAETTLVASALAAVAWLVGRAGGTGPALRHALWLVVLVKLMTPPLVHWPWSSPVPTFRTPTEATNPRVALLQVNRVLPSEVDPPPTGDAPDSFDDRAGEGDPVEARNPGRVEGIFGVWVRWPTVGPLLLSTWLVGSLAVAFDQARRIVRFRGTLREARPAPRWLVDEAERIGGRMSVRVPTIRVVERLGTPVLWCLGRPVLLVPSGLLKSLEADRWPGILAHELAHLRRGDPWVGRLELLALLAWWWNPLYWLARRQVDFEAELACDAWVLWALPEGRIEYAESLVRICTSPSPAWTPSPALGVAGAGRSFERRLVMILRERVSHNASLAGLLSASLLAAVAFPSWTVGATKADEPAPTSPTLFASPTSPTLFVAFAPDDDDDDDDKKPAPKPKTDPKPKPKPKDKKVKLDFKIDVKRDGDAKGAASDAAFEKEMQELGEKIGKEMEEKFGPGSDFEKKMELFGKDMEKNFGPDFEKKMEAFGKEMAEKFGPGSDFEKKMKAYGERVAKENGVGPDSEKKAEEKAAIDAKAKAEDSKAKAKSAMQKAEVARQKAEASRAKAAEARAKADPTKPATKAKSEASRRARRIEILESRIDDMVKELKQLKGEKDDDEEDEEAEKGAN